MSAIVVPPAARNLGTGAPGGTPTPRSGSGAREERLEPALAIQRDQIGIATDMHVAHEDLRHRALPVGTLHQSGPGHLVPRHVHLLVGDALGAQVLLGP